MDQKVIQALKRDKILAKLLVKQSLPNITKSKQVYNPLIQSIISQQLSVKAADTIYQRFLNLFPNRVVEAELLLQIEKDLLREQGLSNQKANYVRNVTLFFKEKDLFHYDWDLLSDNEVIDLLTQIKGVGNWTANMILIFSLGRPDILPLGDQVIFNQIKKYYNLQGDRKSLMPEMLKIAKVWQPYRSFACRYLWADKDN